MNRENISYRKREIEGAIEARNNGEVLGCLKYATEDELKELRELSVREMVNSILCYGNASSGVGEYDRNRYFIEADKLLGKEKVNSIINDQTKYFREHAKVLYGVYEDSEGCTYNSIQWN